MNQATGKKCKLKHSTNCMSLYCEIKCLDKITVYQKYDIAKKLWAWVQIIPLFWVKIKEKIEIDKLS